MTEGSRTSKAFRLVLVAICIGLIVHLLADLGFEEATRQLQNMHTSWLAYSCLCMIATFFFAALRYQCLLDTRLPLHAVLKVILASFLLNYASMVQGLGIGAKIGLLKQNDISVTQSSAGIWIELFLDALICGLFAISYLFLEQQFTHSLLTLALTVIAIPVVLLLTPVILQRLPLISNNIENFRKSVVKVSSPGKISKAALYTCMSWIAAAAGLYCILKSLAPGSEVGLADALGAMTTGFLTGLASMIPGGIGVRELTWTTIVSSAGYPVGIAALAAILYRVLAIFVVALLLSLWSGVKKLTS